VNSLKEIFLKKYKILLIEKEEEQKIRVVLHFKMENDELKKFFEFVGPK
jgi:hypothetical protein